MKYLIRFSTHEGRDIYFESDSLFSSLKKAILEKSKYYYITLFYTVQGKIKLKLLFSNGLKVKPKESKLSGRPIDISLLNIALYGHPSPDDQYIDYSKLPDNCKPILENKSLGKMVIMGTGLPNHNHFFDVFEKGHEKWVKGLSSLFIPANKPLLDEFGFNVTNEL
ncbi:hypothetical protein [Flavobacterium sp. FlaQc-50]|uniref:hypothetical protein n=1 Tax=unclassified Flavobacterium TaxID=196869 RepID=UPI003756D671